MAYTHHYCMPLQQTVQMLWSFYSLLELIQTVLQRTRTLLALIVACNESTSIAQLLLKAHVNVNSRNKQGCTALEVCHAKLPNKKLVKMLVKAGTGLDMLH